jgi:hypothetical protein
MISSFASIAVSGTRFRAIGGTVVQDLNGYRHHVFNSSDTITISGNPKQVYVLAQDGGNSPPTRLTGRAAAGGSSGEARYLQTTLASGTKSIVIGGAGSASYIGNISSTTLNTNISMSGGAGGFFNASPENGTAGQTGFLHSEKNSIYNSLTTIPTRSGGSGGGGGYVGLATGGQFGGGNGGQGSSRNGVNALANSGAGGGGSSSTRGALTCQDYFGNFYQCGWFEGTRGIDGLGGSGYLVISYALS